MTKLLKKKAEHADGGAALLRHQDDIAKEAYYLAEKRSFEPGGEIADWLTAEDTLNASRT